MMEHHRKDQFASKNFTELCQETQQHNIKQLLERANAAKAAIVRTLQSRYASELLPGHMPRLWDPHKKRHREKVKGAQDLLQECKTPCCNLVDLNQFIEAFAKLEKLNNKIDKNGGRLGGILSQHHGMVDAIHADFRLLNNDMNNLLNMHVGLINHRIAREEEMNIATHYMRFSESDEREDQKRLTRKEVMELNAKYDAYTSEYKKKKELLVEYLMRMKGIDQKDEAEKKKISIILDKEMKGLTDIMDEITMDSSRQTSMTPYEHEKNSIKGKIEFLRSPVLQQIQFERIYQDIIECKEILDELKEEPFAMIGFLIQRELLRCYVEKLEYEERKTFWDRILHATYERKRNVVSFLLDSNNTVKLEWYKLCYSKYYRDRKIKIKVADSRSSSQEKLENEDSGQKKLGLLSESDLKNDVDHGNNLNVSDQSRMVLTESSQSEMDEENNLIRESVVNDADAKNNADHGSSMNIVDRLKKAAMESSQSEVSEEISYRRFELNDVIDQLDNSRLARELKLCMDITCPNELKTTMENALHRHLKEDLKIPDQEKMTTYDIEHEDFNKIWRYVRTAMRNKVGSDDNRYKITLLHKWEEHLTRYFDRFKKEIDLLNQYLLEMRYGKYQVSEGADERYLANFVNVISSKLLEVGLIRQEDLLRECPLPDSRSSSMLRLG